MFRCVLSSAFAAACLVAVLPVLPLPSHAQGLARPFPATALRGTLEVTQPPEVLLNGQPARLAPGARIRNADNLLQLSGALVGQRLLVHYTRDALDNVHLVWILTPEEADRRPWPSTADEAQRWLFDPSTQTWTRR